MTISPAATTVLARAAERPDRRLQFHRKLPTGGRHKMIDALLRNGLIEQTLGDYRLGDASTLIEDSATGLMLTTLVLTDAGFGAIDRDPPAAEPAATVAPTVPSAEAVAQEAAAIADALDAATVAPTLRANLRAAAAAVLAAWDDGENRDTDIIGALEGPMANLRALLAEKAPRDAGTPRKPREGTKQEAVLTLLRRTEGATIVQIAEATGWASHTVRGFLAGLKKKGIKIETLEKVRMVGPNRDGAKGSYTVYRAG
ncbi:MAG: DUF3489 domain-containing protein [Alphaproteobacteria bacterium]|nr:DUF3489 domain-containing protein [Alphaproteobacteria bacterium]